jgi:putative tryptophan/tyrosine transport system substrate-binding protein
MWNTGKRLFLGLALILVAATVLLVSDWKSRRGQGKRQGPLLIAVLKHASNSLLDEVETGMLTTLESRGYRNGENTRIQRFCSEGDQATSNMIAKQITDGSYRLVLTISTLSLQAVAGANKEGKAIHVFAAVTDPSGAKVGIRRMDSTEKPPYLTGIGTFQPVEKSIRLAKSFLPGLKVLGAVWNPAEANSEACVMKARAACKNLGITLLESSVEQSRDVREAAESLLGRGIQAFWLGGDVTVSSAVDAYANLANKAGIPLFTNTSGYVRKGACFDLGANYFEVGSQEARIAADILDGKVDPAKYAVSDFMPARIMLNEAVRRQLKEPWRFTEEAVKQAAMIIDENGKEIRQNSDLGEPAAAPEKSDTVRK